METYKLKFSFLSKKTNTKIKCSIIGIVPSQIRETFYSILTGESFSHKDVLASWKREKGNMELTDLNFPIVNIKEE